MNRDDFIEIRLSELYDENRRSTLLRKEYIEAFFPMTSEMTMIVANNNADPVFSLDKSEVIAKQFQNSDKAYLPFNDNRKIPDESKQKNSMFVKINPVILKDVDDKNETVVFSCTEYNAYIRYRAISSIQGDVIDKGKTVISLCIPKYGIFGLEKNELKLELHINETFDIVKQDIMEQIEQNEFKK